MLSKSRVIAHMMTAVSAEELVMVAYKTRQDKTRQHLGLLAIRVWHLFSQISECMFTIVKLLLCKGYHII